MHTTSSQQHGFSLLELMVTLAIVAIIAALALPSMGTVLGGSEARAASNDLVYALQSARSEAIKRITPVGLCPSADPQAANPVCGGNYQQGWIVFVDQDGNGINSGADTLVLQSEALSPAFSLTPDRAFVEGVLFSISGTSVTRAGTPISGAIAIEHDGTAQTYNVRIAASGRVTGLPSGSQTTDGASG